MNKCEAGHKKHDRIVVKTDLGLMMIYDFEKYKDQAGIYCTGQDDISRTLKNEGTWGRQESEMIQELLKKGDKEKVVFDFGCHIGWYSIMAAQLGYTVVAIDGDPENVELLAENALMHGVGDKILISTKWIDKDIKVIEVDPKASKIELLKIDLEGNEQYAILMMENYLRLHQIQNIFMEVTPVFNNSYPALVRKIVDYGYHVFKDGKPFDFNYDFSQENLLFKL